MRRSLIQLAPLALLLSGTSALAQTGPWTVSEANGSVTIIDENGQRAARAGVRLDSGDRVQTGARSSAVLVRGREFVTVRQNSRVRLPEEDRERSVIQMIQDFGSALFNIGRQPDPHFGVETPYLAAVVKGTIFSITVAEEGATLQVTEGAVETSTLDGGAMDLILPGSVAMVAAGDDRRLIVEGETTKVIDSPARPATAATPSAPAPAISSSSRSYKVTTPAVNATNPFASSEAAQRINASITSSPSDLGDLSDGFISGQNEVLIASAVADSAVGRDLSASFTPAVAPQNPADLVAENPADASVCFDGSCSDAADPIVNPNLAPDTGSAVTGGTDGGIDAGLGVDAGVDDISDDGGADAVPDAGVDANIGGVDDSDDTPVDLDIDVDVGTDGSDAGDDGSAGDTDQGGDDDGGTDDGLIDDIVDDIIGDDDSDDASDDDGNNGHGNDDGNDPSNPGNGNGNGDNDGGDNGSLIDDIVDDIIGNDDDDDDDRDDDDRDDDDRDDDDRDDDDRDDDDRDDDDRDDDDRDDDDRDDDDRDDDDRDDDDRDDDDRDDDDRDDDDRDDDDRDDDDRDDDDRDDDDGNNGHGNDDGDDPSNPGRGNGNGGNGSGNGPENLGGRFSPLG